MKKLSPLTLASKCKNLTDLEIGAEILVKEIKSYYDADLYVPRYLFTRLYCIYAKMKKINQ